MKDGLERGDLEAVARRRVDAIFEPLRVAGEIRFESVSDPVAVLAEFEDLRGRLLRAEVALRALLDVQEAEGVYEE